MILLAASSGTGSVEGHLHLVSVGLDDKRLPALPAENATIVLEDAPAGARKGSPPRHFQMRQEHRVFVPNFLAIQVGDVVDFANTDDPKTVHNVFSNSPARRFDVGKQPPGATRSITFDEPGVVDVFCDIHAAMKATILVVPNAAFAQTDANGQFRFTGVSPGPHKVIAWRGHGRPAVSEVNVEAGKGANVDLELEEPQTEAIDHLNKFGQHYRDAPAYDRGGH
jgi:plastocyanin